jgi:hypothetical protein
MASLLPSHLCQFPCSKRYSNSTQHIASFFIHECERKTKEINLEKQDSLTFIEFADTQMIKVFTNKRSQKSETSAPNTRLSELQTVDIDKEQIMVLVLETYINHTENVRYAN